MEQPQQKCAHKQESGPDQQLHSSNVLAYLLLQGLQALQAAGTLCLGNLHCLLACLQLLL